MNPWKSPELSFRRRHLPHLEVPDATYFVSFTCFNRLELPAEARDLLMAEIRSLDKDAIEFDAAVIMPDHAHAIFRVIGKLTLTQILKASKAAALIGSIRSQNGRARSGHRKASITS